MLTASNLAEEAVMNSSIQRMCAWGGVAMTVLWVGGFWVFCGFVPPPSPSASAAQIAEIFNPHLNSIRFGLLLCMIGSALLAPFCSVITVQLKRIEGARATLSYAQLVLGACLILEFIIPVMFLEGALIRPRPAEMLQTLDDITWVMFVGTVSTAVVQLILIGVVMLSDRRPEPIFPRWLGYLNLWVGVLFFGGGLCVFFRTGPFAWTGVFAFWLPLSVFGVWVTAMTAYLLRAISQDRPETEDPHQRLEQLAAELARLRDGLAADRDSRRPPVHS